MSVTILALAKSFQGGRLSASEFANAFMELWKFERDAEMLQLDEASLNECLSSIFCLADLYNPHPDRDGYELDENQLRMKISERLTDFKH